MAQGTKAENTAVNRLIELAQGKPLDDGGFDDLFVDGTARAAREAAKRAVAAPAAAPGKPALPPPFRPSGSMPAAKLVPNAAPPPPLPAGRVPTSTRTDLQAAPAAPPPPQHHLLPQADDIPTKPFDMVDDIEVEVAPVEVVTTSVTAVVAPLPPPPRAVVAPRLPPLPAPMADEESWYEASRAVDRVDDFNATDDVPRVRRGGQTVWFIGAAFALGLAVAALLFWPGDGRAPAERPATAQPAVAAAPAAPAPAPAAAVAPAPAAEVAVQELPPAPEVAPLPEPTPAPGVVPSTDVTLTFESSPPGATVILVDGSDTIPLGPAPVEHTVAAGKRYEAMFSLPGHVSTIVPVDPALGSRVAATLASAGALAEAAVAAAPEPEPAVAEPAVAKATAAVASKDVPRASRRDRSSDRKPKREAKAEAPAARPAAKAAAAGKGVLMLAAKPPCDIVIDGKKTGLVTPQRSIDLPAGKHSITLVNREHGIKESFSVTVKSGASVKVVKDLTKRMK